MKKIKFLSFFLFIYIFSVANISCKKFLEEKSNKSLVVPQSVEDLQGIFDQNFIMNSQTPGFGEASADDFFATPASYNSFGEFSRLSYIWNVKRYNFPNDWASSYQVIWSSNYVLENIDKAERNNLNAVQWDNVKGSALFYRGYYFLNLAWEFCKAYDSASADKDLGIVLRRTADYNVPSVRSTVAETYRQIIADLTEAVNYLPVNSIHQMRPSKAAAYGALARAWLSVRNYDSTLKYADLMLQLKNDLLDYNSAEVNGASQTPFQPFNKEIVFFTTQSGAYSTTIPSNASIDTLLYNSYLTDDKRKTVFFRPFNGYYRFKGNYIGIGTKRFSGIAVDEMYLTRAECFARLGNVRAAMDDLNTLLVKRWKSGTFIPFTADTPQEALEIILIERRKELVMRCLRWIDIKRLNKEGSNIIPKKVIENITYTLQANENRYALPLPDDVINLTGMQQN